MAEGGPYAGLPHQRREVGRDEPGRTRGEVVEAYVGGERHLSRQHAELLAATGRVGQRDRDLVVEQAGRAQLRVDGLGSTRRADDGDPGPQRVGDRMPERGRQR